MLEFDDYEEGLYWILVTSFDYKVGVGYLGFWGMLMNA
jgi:hypothetical protein